MYIYTRENIFMAPLNGRSVEEVNKICSSTYFIDYKNLKVIKFSLICRKPDLNS